jgi:hydroxymethylpyrimidine/phosphomethylpyrimidine kinase
MAKPPEGFRSVLSVAGSDPSGGAGLQLDLQVFARHGVHGMAVATALTVQSTKGVARVHPTFPSVVSEQLQFLLEDIRPDAIKVGMLATDDIVLRVGSLLARLDVPRVVDPVLRASDGSYLLERRAWGHLVERVIAGCALVTPNLEEARLLTDEPDPEKAGRALLAAGAGAVFLKGGHALGAPDDLLLTKAGGTRLPGTRVDVGPVHGTGCALSSAIAARIARGESLEQAVRGAKEFVARAIERSVAAGEGQRLLRLPDASESA